MTGPSDGRDDVRLTKSDRVLRRADFLAAQSQGRRVHTTHFVLLLRDRTDGQQPRLGITTSRKVAKSVGRNRLRRLLREVFRHHKQLFPRGHDCIVIVREQTSPELSLDAVREELLAALAQKPRRGPPPGQGARRDTQQARPSGDATNNPSRPDRRGPQRP